VSLLLLFEIEGEEDSASRADDHDGFQGLFHEPIFTEKAKPKKRYLKRKVKKLIERVRSEPILQDETKALLAELRANEAERTLFLEELIPHLQALDDRLGTLGQVEAERQKERKEREGLHTLWQNLGLLQEGKRIRGARAHKDWINAVELQRERTLRDARNEPLDEQILVILLGQDDLH